MIHYFNPKSNHNNVIKETLFNTLGYDLRCFGVDKKGCPCNKGGLTPSHLFKESDAQDINGRVDDENLYRYSDVNNVIPLCMACHMVYEKLPVLRIEYALSKGVKETRLEYLEKCQKAHSGNIKKYLSNYIDRYKFYENILSRKELDLTNCNTY